MLSTLQSLNPLTRQWLNSGVTALSVLLCLMILPIRLPGMELLGVSPNWLLIWIVAWSVNRPAWLGAMAGLVLGLIQDGMTVHYPTHALSLALVGFLTARLQKQRYIQEDFISIALIVFGMAVVAETTTAIQFSVMGWNDRPVIPTRTLADIWFYHQRVALSSAILSSLWAPVLYYPLNRWWELINTIEQTQA